MKKIEIKGIDVNNSLLNIITPTNGIEFFKDKLRIGDVFTKTYCIINYPEVVDIGWLSKITNIPSTVSTQIYTPINNNMLVENIAKGVRQNEMLLESNNEIVRQRAMKEIAAGQNLLQKIEFDNENVGYMLNLVMVVAEDIETLKERCSRVESIITSLQLKMRGFAGMQRQIYETIAPYSIVNNELREIISRNVPLSTFVGGFSIASSGMNDGSGYYFSKDINGGIVILDTWQRGGDRNNSNFVIMGTTRSR